MTSRIFFNIPLEMLFTNSMTDAHITPFHHRPETLHSVRFWQPQRDLNPCFSLERAAS